MLRIVNRGIFVTAGAVATAILGPVAIGAFLPVKHLVSRTEAFGADPERLWPYLLAELRRRNDGTFTIAEEEPPYRLVTRMTDRTRPLGGSWTYELRPFGLGTQLTIVERGEIYNPFFRFVARFALGSARTLDRFFADLRTAVLSGPPQPLR